jgi:putative ABC transport system ATP-binding protein
VFIRVEDVHKEYQLGQQQVVALAGVTLHVAAGEFIAIMGSSGSGKSTLLNAVGSLDRPTHGRIFVGELELTALAEAALCAYRRQRVGFVFQKFNLVGSLTAAENVEFPLLFSGVPTAQRRARAQQALAAVGLADRMAHRPHELSGGQQQRVALARALVHNPDLLLADEPTGNLDTQTGAEIMALLAEVCRAGRTVLVVTHDERIAGFAHRVIRMRDGHILPGAVPATIHSTPQPASMPA